MKTCIGSYVTPETVVLDKVKNETIIDIKNKINKARELRGISLMVTEQSPPCSKKKRA